MATLESGFEDKLREALLDEMEQKAREEWAPKLLEYAHEILDAYGEEHDYDVEHVKQSAETIVERTDNGVRVRVGWEAEESVYFALGTSDHTVEGDPLLVFEFDQSEYPGLSEAFPDGTAFLQEVDVTGLPESRYVRDALARLRREVAR
jgi:hypothetical protein